LAGATPTLKLKKLTLSAPTWITLAPKSFFGTIQDGNLGLVTTGLKVATPLNLGARAGKWTVYANAQYYHLANDNLVAVKAAINRGDHARDMVQFGVGMSVGFRTWQRDMLKFRSRMPLPMPGSNGRRSSRCIPACHISAAPDCRRIGFLKPADTAIGWLWPWLMARPFRIFATATISGFTRPSSRLPSRRTATDWVPSARTF
jgi:hypothetical protein